MAKNSALVLVALAGAAFLYTRQKAATAAAKQTSVNYATPTSVAAALSSIVLGVTKGLGSGAAAVAPSVVTDTSITDSTVGSDPNALFDNPFALVGV
jgi:hypothetical protein